MFCLILFALFHIILVDLKPSSLIAMYRGWGVACADGQAKEWQEGEDGQGQHGVRRRLVINYKGLYLTLQTT